MKSETPKMKFQVPANYASLGSRDRLDVQMPALFDYLLDQGGTARGSNAIAALAASLPLVADDLEPMKTNGSPRWETNVRFHTSDCLRAGYITKNAGWWTVTDNGKDALKKHSAVGAFIRSAVEISRAQRKAERASAELDHPGGSAAAPTSTAVQAASSSLPDGQVSQQLAFEAAQESAAQEIEARINSLSPYDFQNLVAELLRGMGYVVREIAAPGADGGIDIVAYVDGFGVQGPRLRVQVKRRDAKATAKELRELHGLLRDGDVGLFVSSGGFTSEAIREARQTAKHIDLMDLPRLIGLWQEHYPKLREQGRNMLRLTPVYFLTPEVL